MLNCLPQRVTNCETHTRRDFMLRVGTLGGVGLSLDQLLRLEACAAPQTRDSERSCILIWTRGGTSHHDTLDPKPDAKPQISGEFGVVNTTVPGVQFSDQMPSFAKHFDKFAVVRNLNSLNGAHQIADAIMMSGHKVNPTVKYPCYGSVIAHERGHRNNMPAFVQLGNDVDRKFFGGTAGYLGIAYNPFEIHGDPNDEKFTVKDLTPPGGVNLARINLRRDALKTIDTFQRQLDQQPPALGALDDYYQSAFRMITSAATQRAFDLDREPASVRDAYGRHKFGQSCLLARRLIEAGTRFVTVSSGGWDTHKDNFNELKKLLPPLDQAFPALLADMKERGLLEKTLIVWLTDFGRTPTVNVSSGRDHWSSAGIACFAGAGVPGKTVVGETDAIGGHSVGNEYYPQDIAATIYTKLGIPLDSTHQIGDGRPMRLCDGRVIEELA